MSAKKKELKYRKPKLIELEVLNKNMACENGSGDAIACQNGLNATTNCLTGSSAFGQCTPGSLAGLCVGGSLFNMDL